MECNWLSGAGLHSPLDYRAVPIYVLPIDESSVVSSYARVVSVTKSKYLGIIIDNELSWQCHIDDI